MAAQLVWVVIAALSLLIGGGATVIALNWDKIVLALKGKKIAVLGARGVGKTHLIRFLSTGSIPAAYKQTVAPEKASARRFQLCELDLKLKKTLDLSGDKAAYAEWKELHDSSDVVLYLLRADRLMVADAEVEARVRADLRHIGGWLEASSKRPRFFIVGTHCDLDSEFSGIPPDREGDYVDKFQRLPVMTELVARGGGAHLVKVVLGSMKKLEDTEVLVYRLFNQVLT
jgi:hypothetical protein